MGFGAVDWDLCIRMSGLGFVNRVNFGVSAVHQKPIGPDLCGCYGCRVSVLEIEFGNDAEEQDRFGAANQTPLAGFSSV